MGRRISSHSTTIRIGRRARRGARRFWCATEKGKLVRTTIDTLVGRRGDACGRTLEETLGAAQQLFADVAAFLELEIDRLFAAEVDETDETRIEAVRKLITLNQQALMKVIDISGKIGLTADGHARQMLDLEDARAEIDRRLARLAA
ncbi:hypothetical protein LNKW23_04370 [Paralimibaculum aggregatum]|uniref:Uncharacterized protein n=2 Tax=Paralimibaculum aggregatum TaxID=3036245 RepID=A0ABQ6LCY0_9RHOB|nr:hypothetical protein LNKW23_04370 [Limibaculum sp. NKW23]